MEVKNHVMTWEHLIVWVFLQVSLEAFGEFCIENDFGWCVELEVCVMNWSRETSWEVLRVIQVKYDAGLDQGGW